MPRRPPARASGVRSVATAMALLGVFARARGPLGLSEIARRAGLAPAKAHRYLASLVEAGMVTQRRGGAYDLGPTAAEIGMAAVARVDVVNRAADLLPVLVDETGATAMLSVWGSAGPTVVRWERASPPLVTALGVGSVLPVATSATGLAFLAWSPERLTRPMLPDLDAKAAAALGARIRAAGLAEARESFIPGLFALAAPVLDLQGQACAAVTLISTDRAILDAGSTPRAALVRHFPPARHAGPGARPP